MIIADWVICFKDYEQNNMQISVEQTGQSDSSQFDSEVKQRLEIGIINRSDRDHQVRNLITFIDIWLMDVPFESNL